MLLDTSTLVEIFQSREDSERYRKIVSKIGEDEIYVSIVQLAEVDDWALKNKQSVLDLVSRVREIATIVPLDEQICLDAATIKLHRRKTDHKNFGLIDGIILASARTVDQHLLTFDNHFAGEEDCVVMT